MGEGYKNQEGHHQRWVSPFSRKSSNINVGRSESRVLPRRRSKTSFPQFAPTVAAIFAESPVHPSTEKATYPIKAASDSLFEPAPLPLAIHDRKLSLFG